MPVKHRCPPGAEGNRGSAWKQAALPLPRKFLGATEMYEKNKAKRIHIWEGVFHMYILMESIT